MLRLEHISKQFQSRCILGDVSLTLAKGDLLCMTGPSGIGKTTLLEIAAGIVRPDAGSRIIRFSHMACLLQDAPLLPWKTALENMDFILSARISGEKRYKNSLFWLEKMGLQEAAHKKPMEMSGGMQRRLAMAACFAGEPDLLLLDEPFAFLDALWQARIWEEIVAMNQKKGTAIFMVSHATEQLRDAGIRIVPLAASPLSIDI
ncbi:NitT/TauT family transport system ATP-binding protein/sulfonate transport system ATP-binding protein [Desulfobotulus alkaliphilus]|uniref:NitT/TauT family transport system ATP-binding protein/sulfonate transport system ATP-binding protein n=1 Tax=Desulfobotulus alkaliphilus TaxID=622671 RepID=A0A562RD23_9BACT|nr:ATP-binding cassette domain-containing protein [Desulfobotulus alkaliphilus]TWI66955.1 NitT/TauT family transport system ATP-binding protein/sulfonate transport system ATP-binding protein [Desulfobotulus alkaliphilus]